MNLFDLIDRSPVFEWALFALVALCLVSNAVEKRIVDARRGKS